MAPQNGTQCGPQLAPQIAHVGPESDRNCKTYLEPTCGNPYPDASGIGYLLPCNQAVFGKDGKLIGVAGIDMTLDQVIHTMQGHKAYMLNENLEIMLRSEDQGLKSSSEESLIKDNKEKMRLLFQDQTLLGELKKGKSSGVAFNREKKVSYAYAKLQFAPWTLVLEIPDSLKLQ